MGQTRTRTTLQATYAAVRERTHEDGSKTYDVWRWDLFKRKWTRMSHTACDFGSTEDATPTAQEVDRETREAVEHAKTLPPPLK